LALTGGDEIQIHQENNDHNDHNNNTGNDQDTTGTAAATGGAAGGPGTTNFKLRVEQNNILEFFGSNVRTPFQLQISSGNWRILPRQTDGPTLKPTTTSPTHSGIQLQNGSLQWSIWTTMSTTKLCGQISRKSSNKNILYKQTKD
jgi:hypothetical protein